MPRARRRNGALIGLTLAWAFAAAAVAEDASQAPAAPQPPDPARAQRTSPTQASAQKTSPAQAPTQKSSLDQAPAQKTLPAQAPTQWLERMNHALTTRNYDGTFSHWHGGHVEMLRIIHRVQDGSVSERLASLDGSGREAWRVLDPGRQQCPVGCRDQGEGLPRRRRRRRQGRVVRQVPRQLGNGQRR